MLETGDICTIDCKCSQNWKWQTVNGRIHGSKNPDLLVKIVRRRNVGEVKRVTYYVRDGDNTYEFVDDTGYTVEYVNIPEQYYGVRTTTHKAKCLTTVNKLTEEDKQEGVEGFE